MIRYISVEKALFWETYMRSWSEETRFVRPAMLTLELSLALEGRLTHNGNLRSRKVFHRPIKGPGQVRSEVGLHRN
jgi:hypothetical protein